MNDPQHIVFFRDEDDNNVYRIDVGPALAAFQRMSIDPASRELVATTNQSLLIPMEPSIVEVTDPDTFSLLPSEVVGQLTVGLANPDANLIQQDTPATDVCPVCQDEIQQDVHVKTRCGHSYCQPCIRSWFAKHTTCPLCNTKLG